MACLRAVLKEDELRREDELVGSLLLADVRGVGGLVEARVVGLPHGAWVSGAVGGGTPHRSASGNMELPRKEVFCMARPDVVGQRRRHARQAKRMAAVAAEAATAAVHNALELRRPLRHAPLPLGVPRTQPPTSPG